MKRGVLIVFMAAMAGLMLAPATGTAQAEEPAASSSDVGIQAGTTYDKYNCYVQWYNTYGKNVCGGNSKSPNGWVSLGLWCEFSFDHVGPEYHMNKGQKKDPIDAGTCTFSVAGGKNTWS